MLSTSRFLSGAHCHLRFWYDYRARDATPEPDAALQHILVTRHGVGELACKLFPGGHSFAPNHQHDTELRSNDSRQKKPKKT